MVFRIASTLAPRLASLAAALVMSVGSLGVSPAAVASGIFLGMEGSWRGDGAIKYTSGESESMTCVAKNEVSDDGNKIKQVLTCAFASGGDKLKVTSDLSYRAAAGVVVGHWRESSYGVNGQISGTATSTKITAQVKSTSQNLSIGVEVVMNGAQQMVVLRPTNLDVTEVRVLLSKS